MLLNPLNRRIRHQQGLPVLPGAFPVVGHLPAVAFDLPELLAYAERRLGAHFWLEMGRFGRMLVCTRTAAFDLLRSPHLLSDLLGEVAPPLRDTMSTQDGEVHRRTRGWATPPFQPHGLAGAGVGELFAEMTLARMRRWHDVRSIRLVQEASDLALSMLFRLLGVDERDLHDWQTTYRDYFLVSLPSIELPGRRSRRRRRAQAWIDARLLQLMRDVRNRPEASGLLPAFMRSLATSGESPTDASLLGDLRGLIHAGHKTTAVTMAQMTIALAQYPACWDALRAEARAAGDVPRTPAQLAAFPYAHALFREALRLHPAFPLIFRRTAAAIDVGGRVVEAGTKLIVPLCLLSRDPNLHQQPERFMVERWLRRRDGLTPIETLQFGNGPHRCLGTHMAAMQLVQFAVALALTMDAAGLRPLLADARPTRGREFSIHSPSKAVRIVFG